MNERFEEKTIYKTRWGYGCGYDEVSGYDYYLPIRRSESNIWFRRLRMTLVEFGKEIAREFEADAFAYLALNNPDSGHFEEIRMKLSKLGDSWGKDSGSECARHKGESVYVAWSKKIAARYIIRG